MDREKIHQGDSDLLQKIRKGDLTAYRHLFDTYFSDLCNFLMIYLHDQSFSEEVALEIFTQIWEKRDSLDIHTSLKSYLFTSAKNRSVSFFRRERRKLFSSLDIDNTQHPIDLSSQFYMENEELKKLISDAIESLPEKSRQIYKMAWEENLSHKEISEKLGITPKTVENHVGIALRKLRAALLPYYRQIFMMWWFFHMHH